MKSRILPYLVACFTTASVLTLTTATYGAGGSLTPPGAPAVTMKSLDEIEPGIPINPADVGVTGILISQPGYYYLTGNIENVPATSKVFQITVSNVTLDLRGFALIADGGTGTSDAQSAIYTSNIIRNIVIKNGIIDGAWYAGVHLLAKPTVRCENLQIHETSSYGIRVGTGALITDCQINGGNTGIDTAGILTSHSSIIRNCSVILCTGDGIAPIGGRSTIIACTASENDGYGFNPSGDSFILRDCVAAMNGVDGFNVGINATISNCTAYLNTGNGFTVGNVAVESDGSTLISCTSFTNSENGFEVGDGCSLTSCIASNNTLDGFVVEQGSTLISCTAKNNTKEGFDCTSDVLIESCVATKNQEFGFSVDTGCHVIDSIASDNYSSGFNADNQNSFSNCIARDNGRQILNQFADGFLVSYGNSIRNCRAYNNVGNGIQGTNILNEIRDNHLYSNDSNGIKLTDTANLVIGNYANANSLSNYDITAGAISDIGPVESAATGTNPHANFD